MADVHEYAPPSYPGADYFEGICRKIRDLGPGEFMLVAGDLKPPEQVRATLDSYFGPQYPMYAAVGNHELDKPEYIAYLREFNRGGRTLPNIVRSGPPGAVETCYSLDNGPVHVVVINQYYDGTRDDVPGGDISPALYDWLAEDLAANDRPYVFVVGHEPMVSIPDMDNGRVRHLGDSLDEHMENNHRFASLLRRHKVTAFICGHTHNASAARINGLWQINSAHARGLGDPGAASTFLRICIQPDGAKCDFYRASATGYQLVYEEHLN